MLSMLETLRRKLFRPVPRRKPPQRPRFAKPRLEILEDRFLLATYVFVGAAGGGDGTSWNNANNWVNTTTGLAGLPGPTDDAVIGAINNTTFNVLLSGNSATVNSVGLGTGCTLTVSSSLEANGIATDAATLFTVNSGAQVQVDQSATFSGPVVDTGTINANTTNPLTGTTIVFAGGATIGPGDLNGNLVAGPSSSITFAGGTNTLVAGATFGQGAGDIYIASPVSVMGDLLDSTVNLDIVAGGDLTGPGSLADWWNVNWTGGTISLTGGVTVY
jgi:hypothetical protein